MTERGNTMADKKLRVWTLINTSGVGYVIHEFPLDHDWDFRKECLVVLDSDGFVVAGFPLQHVWKWQII